MKREQVAVLAETTHFLVDEISEFTITRNGYLHAISMVVVKIRGTTAS